MKTKPVGDYSDRLFCSVLGDDTECHFTYIIQSTSTGQFFVGSCSDLLGRFNEHQSDAFTDTRGRGPWWLPYYEIYENRADALARAAEIKGKKSSKYIKTTIFAAFPLMELY